MTIRSRNIPIFSKASKLAETASSTFPPESGRNVARIDGRNNPEPPFPLYLLDVRSPDQMPIRKPPIWPFSRMSKNHAHSAACLNLDIHQECSDLILISLSDSSSNSEQIKVRVTLNMEVD